MANFKGFTKRAVSKRETFENKLYAFRAHTYSNIAHSDFSGTEMLTRRCQNTHTICVNAQHGSTVDRTAIGSQQCLVDY